MSDPNGWLRGYEFSNAEGYTSEITDEGEDMEENYVRHHKVLHGQLAEIAQDMGLPITEADTDAIERNHHRCPGCDGTGEVDLADVNFGNEGAPVRWGKCDWCNGTGIYKQAVSHE